MQLGSLNEPNAARLIAPDGGDTESARRYPARLEKRSIRLEVATSTGSMTEYRLAALKSAH